MAHEQEEFDYGDRPVLRLARALRAGGRSVRVAVPLSENDRLMLVCMNGLAQKIADETNGLPQAESDRLTSRRVAAIIGALDEVSESFALETARYLTEAVHRLRVK